MSRPAVTAAASMGPNVAAAHETQTQAPRIKGSTLFQRLELPISAPVSPCLSVDASGQLAVLGARTGLYLAHLEEPSRALTTLIHNRNDLAREVTALQFNPNASAAHWIASAAARHVYVWDLSHAERPFTGAHSISQRSVSDVDWSPHEGSLLATCSGDPAVKVWDVRDMRRPVLSLSTWNSGTTQIKWNRVSDQVLASAHETQVHIWDIRKTDAATARINAHARKICGIDWSYTDQRYLVTCSQDRKVKFWDTAAPRDSQFMLALSTPVWRARYTPFGEGLVTVAARTDANVRFWRVHGVDGSVKPGMQPVEPIVAYSGHTDVVTAFDWRIVPHEDHFHYQLVSWGRDSMLRLWDLAESHQNVCGGELVAGSAKPDKQDVHDDAPSAAVEGAPAGEPETLLSLLSSGTTSQPPARRPLPQTVGDEDELRREFIQVAHMLKHQVEVTMFHDRRAARFSLTGSGVVLLFTYPQRYPFFAGPTIRVEEARGLTSEQRRGIEAQLTNIASSLADKAVPSTLECLQFLTVNLHDLSTQSLEHGMHASARWLLDRQNRQRQLQLQKRHEVRPVNTTAKPRSADSPSSSPTSQASTAPPSASEARDYVAMPPSIPFRPMTEEQSKAMPCPPLCGASFSPSGRLVYFTNFPTEPVASKVVEHLPRSLYDLEELIGYPLVAAKARLPTPSNAHYSLHRNQSAPAVPSHATVHSAPQPRSPLATALPMRHVPPGVLGEGARRDSLDADGQFHPHPARSFNELHRVDPDDSGDGDFGQHRSRPYVPTGLSLERSPASDGFLPVVAGSASSASAVIRPPRGNSGPGGPSGFYTTVTDDSSSGMPTPSPLMHGWNPSQIRQAITGEASNERLEPLNLGATNARQGVFSHNYYNAPDGRSPVGLDAGMGDLLDADTLSGGSMGDRSDDGGYLYSDPLLQMIATGGFADSDSEVELDEFGLPTALSPPPASPPAPEESSQSRRRSRPRSEPRRRKNSSRRRRKDSANATSATSELESSSFAESPVVSEGIVASPAHAGSQLRVSPITGTGVTPSPPQRRFVSRLGQPGQWHCNTVVIVTQPCLETSFVGRVMVDPWLADHYHLWGKPVPQMCHENAVLAEATGRHALARAWLLAQCVSSGPLPDDWFANPLGGGVARNLLRAFAERADAQHVAAFASVLTAGAEQGGFLGGRIDAPPDEDGNRTASAFAPPAFRAAPALYREAQQPGPLTVAAAEGAGEDDSFSTDHGHAELHMDSGGRAPPERHVPDWDAVEEAQRSRHRLGALEETVVVQAQRVYADYLLDSDRIEARAQLARQASAAGLSSVGSAELVDPDELLVHVPMMAESILICALCECSVKGIVSVCQACGHGGHPAHLKAWFARHDECPSGCGCHCALGVAGIGPARDESVDELADEAVEPPAKEEAVEASAPLRPRDMSPVSEDDVLSGGPRHRSTPSRLSKELAAVQTKEESMQWRSPFGFF